MIDMKRLPIRLFCCTAVAPDVFEICRVVSYLKQADGQTYTATNFVQGASSIMKVLLFLTSWLLCTDVRNY